MVVNENCYADVVFLIEATAHISPYVESFKTNYVIPTLEYFNGTQMDDRDSTFDKKFQAISSLFGIVTYMSMDCKPDSASICYAPTSCSKTFLEWFDKIPFIGGAGDASSHLVEGLCTAIDLFDDLGSYREKMSSDMKGNGVKPPKHCILICNSTPYQEPSTESLAYSGFTLDQLMTVLVEKNINFSVFSPRKMSFLYKLFESGGGNLPNALSKSYARDRRHLVLLNGFYLQEKPVSPLSQPSSIEVEKTPQSIKQSSSPPQIPQISRPNPNPMTPSEPFPSHSKMNEERAMHVRVASPVPSWVNNGNVPSPSTGARNPNQIMRPRVPQINNPNIGGLTASPVQMSKMVAQQSPAGKPPMGQLPMGQSPMGQSPMSQSPMGQPPMGQVNPALRMQALKMQTSFANPIQAPSPQPQPSPHMRPVPSPASIPSSVASPISQPHFMQQSQPIAPQQVGQMNMQPPMINGQRPIIWSGLVEFQSTQGSNNPQSKVTYSLECHITYQPKTNEPDFAADRWPERLNVATVPKSMMNRLSPIFKNSSYTVNFHFPQDSPGHQLLIKALNTFVGCIQLPNSANIRIIILFYMPDKKVFVGFIPHNQEEFMSSMRDLIESHRKEQQVKQKMLQIQHQQQQQQSQMPPMTTSQVSSANPVVAMGGQMHVQMMPSQMGQATHNQNSQMMASSTQSPMFQQINNTMQNTSVNVSGSMNMNMMNQPNQMQMTNATSASMISMPNQQKNVFINNSGQPNMVATSNAGIQLINTSQASSINQMQQSGQQTVNQQMMPANVVTQSNMTGQQQQFGTMSAAGQSINNQGNMSTPTSRSFLPNEQAQMEQMVKMEQPMVKMEQGQMMQPQNSAVVRQHLQQHLQHQQQQQQHLQRQQLNNVPNSQHQQLRHLLQQHGMNPNRMNLQQGQVGMMQQFRFQNAQQQQQVTNQQMQSTQQRGQFYDDHQMY